MSRRLKLSGAKSILLFAIVISLAVGATQARYSGGTGEPNDPYRIATPQDLNNIGNYEEDWDKNFILVNDVNLAEYTGTLFRIIGNPTTKFTGVFDGNDHKIWNFTWSSTALGSGIGLFGYVGNGSQIKNLAMENADVNATNAYYIGSLIGCNGGTITDCYSAGSVSGTSEVGGLVGKNNGIITNCYSTGSVKGSSVVGGLVGFNYHQITHCYSTGNALGNSRVGGLVGENDHGTITDCYSTGSVSGPRNGVGGLVGFNSGTITDCYSRGSVTGTESVGGPLAPNVGGLIGYNSGTITNCYSTGSVSGYVYVGGLVGENWTKVSNSYSTGSVTGTGYYAHVGGLVGYNGSGRLTNCYSTGSVSGIGAYLGGLVAMNSGTITDCYSTGSVSGTGAVGGLVGINPGGKVGECFWDIETSGQLTSSGGTPKTTAEMKTMSTFTDAGWDFIEIWGIGENQTYPFLRTEPAGDSNHDKKVDLADLAILALHWLEGK